MIHDRPTLFFGVTVVALTLGMLLLSRCLKGNDRLTGNPIQADVSVNNRLQSDATVIRTGTGGYVITVDGNQYLVERSHMRWQVGVWIESGTTEGYTPGVRSVLVFPSDGTKSDWNPKLSVDAGPDDKVERITFDTVDGSKLQVRMDE